MQRPPNGVLVGAPPAATLLKSTLMGSRRTATEAGGARVLLMLTRMGSCPAKLQVATRGALRRLRGRGEESDSYACPW
jgi:hypothetical protein